jgi:Transposase
MGQIKGLECRCDPLIFLHERLESGLKEGQTMKRKRFTEEQIIGVLKEAEAGAKTADLARRQRGV